jgi:hypothetical protein
VAGTALYGTVAGELRSSSLTWNNGARKKRPECRSGLPCLLEKCLPFLQMVAEGKLYAYTRYIIGKIRNVVNVKAWMHQGFLLYPKRHKEWEPVG